MTVIKVALLLAAGSVAIAQGERQIVVAAASNLTSVAHALGMHFEADTGIHTVFSFGSTAQLTRQIENGAPFDAFLAADSEHIQELERKGMIAPRSRAVYAYGILALWAPRAPWVKRLEDIARPGIHVIAIANPQLAPYGVASMEALRQAGILEQVKAKIVYGDSIDMARQYGATGNADAVFSAYSLLLHEKNVIQVDEKLHAPITQELGVVAGSTHKEDAQRFIAFVTGRGGRKILVQSGYRLPQ